MEITDFGEKTKWNLEKTSQDPTLPINSQWIKMNCHSSYYGNKMGYESHFMLIVLAD